MATKTKKKSTSAIPSLSQIEKRVEKQVRRLQKDLRRNVKRASREASKYIPKSSRRQIGDIVDRVNDFGDSVTKTVNKTVKAVRSDVEDSFEDLRGTVDKRVSAIRKEATDTSRKAIESFEKETRKQFERLFSTIGLPVRSDIDSIRRRVGALERQVEQLVEGALRKRAKAAESEAA